MREKLREFSLLAREVWGNESLCKWLFDEARFPDVVTNAAAVADSFMFGVRPVPRAHVKALCARRAGISDPEGRSSQRSSAQSGASSGVNDEVHARKADRDSTEFLLFTPCHYLGDNRFTLAIATPSDPHPPEYFMLPPDVVVQSCRVVNINSRMMIVNVQRLSNGMSIIETRYADQCNCLREVKVLVKRLGLDVVKGVAAEEVVMVASFTMENNCQFCILRDGFENGVLQQSECRCPRSMVRGNSILRNRLVPSWTNQAQELRTLHKNHPVSAWALRLFATTPTFELKEIMRTRALLEVEVHLKRTVSDPSEIARHGLAREWIESLWSPRTPLTSGAHVLSHKNLGFGSSSPVSVDVPSSSTRLQALDGGTDYNEPGDDARFAQQADDKDTSLLGVKRSRSCSVEVARVASDSECRAEPQSFTGGPSYRTTQTDLNARGPDSHAASAPRDASESRLKWKLCPECGSSFAQVSHLRQHVELVHLKVKKFECPLCRKMFGTAGNMRQHIVHVHENPNLRAYECSICKKSYKAKSKMQEHQRRAHQSE